VTGVTGSGKTLPGLNISTRRSKEHHDEDAVFLSGNGPLVEVLRVALARDKARREGIWKKTAERAVRSFIQNIHHFRDHYVGNEGNPLEKVVVFDEAQRAWTRDQAANFMQRKRGQAQSHEGSDRQAVGIGADLVAAALQGSISGGLHLSRPQGIIHGFEQLSQARAAQADRGTGTAEADNPGHPSHHHYSWQDEGSRQGYPGHAAAFEGVDDNGCVYAVVGKGRAYGDQLDPRRVDGFGYYRTCSSGAVGGISDLCGVEPDFGGRSTEGEPAWKRSGSSEREEMPPAKPVKRSGFGICDKDATKSRKGGASK
jgi:hypothetical protein